MAGPVPGLVIAGVSSGVGKTTVAAGLAAAIARRGLAVQPFKVGPDYIDPGFLAAGGGRPCRNLDGWMLRPPVLVDLYRRAAAGADLALVEGVMGLFDGHPGHEGLGSTAAVAKLLGLPVVLVLDVARMGQSAAAMAFGYAGLDPEVKVAGVVVNGVGSPGHLRMVREAIETRAGLPVLGHLPRRDDLLLPERHLGLVPAAERGVGEEFFARLTGQVMEAFDLDRILALARLAGEPALEPESPFPAEPVDLRATIAYASDEAFSFYYQDNLDLLAAWGGQLVPFSPLRDETLPAGTSGLYLGGGFPEVFVRDLARNQAMLRAVREAHAAGMPIYAECGGLMYLCRELVGQERERFAMAGVVPAVATMRDSRMALGYVTVRGTGRGFLLADGGTARGHEFHWSGLEQPLDPASAAWVVEEGARAEGYAEPNLVASYLHLHFASNPRLADDFVAACARWRAER